MYRVKKRGAISALRNNMVSVLIFTAVAVMFVTGVREASKKESEEALRIAEDSIHRAVVSCYALEGSYPESFEYIKENYGIHIDEEKYFVDYEIFASNIMPDVTVIEK
ncbi:MAG: hypothetical protein VB120_02020 [Lachnospiraceae bacterium]|nr:hypothetical protein [Lachnospiraceae bacterium]